MFDEITASSLVKIDLAGQGAAGHAVPDQPGRLRDPQRGARGARRRRSACCTRTRCNGVAVSAQKRGVLPISQHSIFVLACLAYHDYEGVALRDDEKPRLVADLGDKTFLMLRNHGLLTVGPTIADAFLRDVHLRDDLRDPAPRAGRRHARRRRPDRDRRRDRPRTAAEQARMATLDDGAGAR